MKTKLSLNFNKWIHATCLFIFVIGCKTTSYNSVPSYGIEKGSEYFSIAVLPDTQYYTSLKNGGTMQMFSDQIQWIRDNRKKENIEYVIHLGDITERNAPDEWQRASSVLYKLDEDKIPYGLTVGNHDETPGNTASKGDPNTPFTKYFGRNHFKDKPWYGGAMGNNENSDNHFDRFTVNGDKYLVMYFVYNEPGNKFHDAGYEKEVMRWADSVLTNNADHKAIMVTHSMLNRVAGAETETKDGTDGNKVEPNFTKQGKMIYEMAKHHSNVFLMLGGHIAGEGFRSDEYNGNVIKTYLADYQARQSAPYGGQKDRNGGNGLMRLMKFNKTQQTLVTTTFAPRPNGIVIKEEDADSKFIKPLFK
ncbi:MAG: metallophosphoesterase [Daejeonella sp.]